LRLKRQSSPSRLEYLVDLGVRGARLFPSLALALVSVLVMVLVFFFCPPATSSVLCLWLCWCRCCRFFCSGVAYALHQ
jgi:hypothetical protein